MRCMSSVLVSQVDDNSHSPSIKKEIPTIKAEGRLLPSKAYKLNEWVSIPQLYER